VVLSTFSLVRYGSHRDLHSFPTRRSSDLEKTILKTWQDTPFLLEAERDGSEGKLKKETPLEKEIRQRFDELRLWQHLAEADRRSDRKSTRLNSSHVKISYAVFCLKKKKKK